MSGNYFGWDIGGAHLKVARIDARGQVTAVRQIACPLWRGIHELGRACALIDFPIDAADAVHAVTMTGELCDVFSDRADGVRQIVDHFLQLISTAARVRIFGGYQGWLSPEEVCGSAVSAVASANWLALAAFTAELIGDGVLLDIGSTTTDIVPIADNEVRCEGRDDAARLGAGELVYTGAVRTPVIGVCGTVPFRGRWQPLAAEVFATTADVYRLLGEIEAHHDLMPTADGRSKDVSGSARRLARMLGLDLAVTSAEEMRRVAAYVARVQAQQIGDALELVCSRHTNPPAEPVLIGAGVGRFIVAALARAQGRHYRGFDALLGVAPQHAEAAAIAAPAVAAGKLLWMTA
ncbi:MAG: hydantoinase/oxoprolinase family protein [Gammaproteobacteria bacterium]